MYSRNIDKKLFGIAVSAFAFSLIGDIFLIFVNNGMTFFMFGLLSFLIAQISYIALFYLSLKYSGSEPYLKRNRGWLLLYLVYGVIIYFLIFNNLDLTLRIAVFIYMTAIIGMSAMALNRLNILPRAGALMVLTGSVFFVVSDSLIALNKFYMPIELDRLLIMVTYMAAQFLIVKGFLKQFN